MAVKSNAGQRRVNALSSKLCDSPAGTLAKSEVRTND